MREFGLFSHWTFETFAPGSIPRSKYNAFRDIHRQSAYCFSQLARFDELVAGDRVVDWCTVSKLTSRLILSIRKLVDLLQTMNPVEFMDAHDWFAKLGFYAKMATEHAAIAATPPYFLSAAQLGEGHPLAWAKAHLSGKPGSPGLVATPSLYQYLVEANDLRPQLDVLLRQLDPADEALLEAASEKLVSMILAAKLPERLQAELEIEAMELAGGGGLLDLLVFAGSGGDALLIGRQSGVRAADFFTAWLSALSCKFSPSALTLRLNLGLADDEHPLTVLACPAQDTPSGNSCDLWEGEPDSRALVRRMEQIVSRVSQLHVFRAQGEALRPEQCRSLHDLVCLCLERGLSQIFAFAGEPSRGLAGIKQMRLEIPVVINTFNLGGGLFPTAAERAVISMEDVRSIPAWSFLLGLVNTVVSWPQPEHADAPHGEASPMPHYSSYAVLSQFFMHCTLRLEQNLYAVECRCDEGSPMYIHFRCMFWGASLAERIRRVEVVRAILEGEGFTVDSRGNYLVATRSCEEDVMLQRNLVSLGLLVAWLQVRGSSLAALEAPEGAQAFRGLLAQSRSNPL
jgi:hypothetical protein